MAIITNDWTGTEYFKDATKIPKYLNVSWLSDFPNEDEKLFYGAYVVFQIDDIIEAKDMQNHSKEVLMFNKFQKLLQFRCQNYNYAF